MGRSNHAYASHRRGPGPRVAPDAFAVMGDGAIMRSGKIAGAWFAPACGRTDSLVAAWRDGDRAACAKLTPKGGRPKTRRSGSP